VVFSRFFSLLLEVFLGGFFGGVVSVVLLCIFALFFFFLFKKRYSSGTIAFVPQPHRGRCSEDRWRLWICPQLAFGEAIPSSGVVFRARGKLVLEMEGVVTDCAHVWVERHRDFLDRARRALHSTRMKIRMGMS
jgi:hypothetical protein